MGLAEAGEEVVISRYGKPIARLAPIAPPGPQRRPGTWRGYIHMADDLDDELDDAWLAPLTPR